MAKDLYFILRVARKATPEDIRSAYRHRALELHPDRSRSGSEPFIELQRAYSVLSDPAQRAAYDRQSQWPSVSRVEGEPSRRRTPAEPFREVEPVRGFRDISLSGSFETFSPSFDEIFHRLWSNFDLLTRPKAERLASLDVDVPLSPDDADSGGAVRVFVPAEVACPGCHGHGAIGPYECWRCQGAGAILVERPVEITYPSGLRRDYVVQVPLHNFGIGNFYLTVRFRPTEAAS